MELITKHTLAREYVKQWAKLAAPSSNNSPRNQLILEKIKAAKSGEEPNPDEVERIVGDRLWTACNECEKENVPVVELGEGSYDSAATTICQDCLKRALALMVQGAATISVPS